MAVSSRQSRGTTRRTTTRTQVSPTETVTVVESPESRQNRRTRPLRSYGPTEQGEKVGGSVGLLEAEFFGIIFLLILQLFVGKASYGEKMLSFMKRGTLATILFFILAMVASAGDNAAKISKAIGALVFVAILLTSPGSDVINALDSFFKADWNPDSSTGQGSADTGTQQQTAGSAAGRAAGGTSQANAFGAAERAFHDATSSLGNLLLTPDITKGGVDLITSGIDGLTNTYKRIFGFFKRIP